MSVNRNVTVPRGRSCRMQAASASRRPVSSLRGPFGQTRMRFDEPIPLVESVRGSPIEGPRSSAPADHTCGHETAPVTERLSMCRHPARIELVHAV
jgi:hypothetical protein